MLLLLYSLLLLILNSDRKITMFSPHTQILGLLFSHDDNIFTVRMIKVIAVSHHVKERFVVIFIPRAAGLLAPSMLMIVQLRCHLDSLSEVSVLLYHRTQQVGLLRHGAIRIYGYGSPILTAILSLRRGEEDDGALVCILVAPCAQGLAHVEHIAHLILICHRLPLHHFSWFVLSSWDEVGRLHRREIAPPESLKRSKMLWRSLASLSFFAAKRFFALALFWL